MMSLCRRPGTGRRTSASASASCNSSPLPYLPHFLPLLSDGVQVRGADDSELASLEEVVGEMLKQKLLPLSVIHRLWAFVKEERPEARQWTAPALRLIAMAAKFAQRHWH